MTELADNIWGATRAGFELSKRIRDRQPIVQDVKKRAVLVYAGLLGDSHWLNHPHNHRVPWAATHISELLRSESIDLIALYNNSGLWDTTFSRVDDLALRRARKEFYNEEEKDKAEDVYRDSYAIRRVVVRDTNAHPYMRLTAELVTAADTNTDSTSVCIRTIGSHLLLYAPEALVSPPEQPSPASPESIAS